MGRLDLLRLGVSDVLVPDVVVAEVGARGSHDVSARAIAGASWLTVAATPPTPEPVRACRLDPGGSAVLALAVGDSDCEVVLDDMAARRCAARFGIPCLGTLGLVLVAKRLGSLPEARPVIERLRQVGLYLDGEFVDDVLRRIGE